MLSSCFPNKIFLNFLNSLRLKTSFHAFKMPKSLREKTAFYCGTNRRVGQGIWGGIENARFMGFGQAIAEIALSLSITFFTNWFISFTTDKIQLPIRVGPPHHNMYAAAYPNLYCANSCNLVQSYYQ